MKHRALCDQTDPVLMKLTFVGRRDKDKKNMKMQRMLEAEEMMAVNSSANLQ